MPSVARSADVGETAGYKFVLRVLAVPTAEFYIHAGGAPISDPARS